MHQKVVKEEDQETLARFELENLKYMEELWESHPSFNYILYNVEG